MLGPMTVIVGSTSPTKVKAAELVFGQLFSALLVRALALPSGVPDQPIGYEETRVGAVNRAQAALKTEGATWGLGLEGGVRFDEIGTAWLFGVVAVGHSITRQATGPATRQNEHSQIYTSRTAELLLPESVGQRAKAGEELGHIMDELWQTTDIKKGVGTVGLLTNGQVTRTQVWQQALALALAPFLHPDIYH